jgi:hypothetical protein
MIKTAKAPSFASRGHGATLTKLCQDARVKELLVSRLARDSFCNGENGQDYHSSQNFTPSW